MTDGHEGFDFDVSGPFTARTGAAMNHNTGKWNPLCVLVFDDGATVSFVIERGLIADLQTAMERAAANNVEGKRCKCGRPAGARA